jgi:hypothetical protein
MGYSAGVQHYHGNRTVGLHEESYLSIKRVASSLERRWKFANSMIHYDRYSMSRKVFSM